MKLLKIIVFPVIMLLILSCATAPIAIPYDLTPMELIQRGQEASDRNRFHHSLQYYDALIERYPFDIDFICAAEYEIAFIHYKQRNFNLSRTKFNNLLARYNAPGGELLPQQFRVLSNIVLARIDEHENRSRRPFASF
jgi:outer membrane protein assembly factor BamD (BamD/ComL family)